MKIQTVCAMALIFAAAVFSLTMQDVQNMPANTWLAVPNTQLQASPVAAPNYLSASEFAKLRGNGFSGLMEAWSGGALDTKRNQMLIWGGGHNDYWGNEVYAFDINTLAWKRLTDACLNPSLGSDGSLGVNANSDGTPMIQHNYNALAYLIHSDRLIFPGLSTWTLDCPSLKWTDHHPSNKPGFSFGNCCVYDPKSKLVYYGDIGSSGGLFSYNDGTNTWTKKNGDDNWYYHTMACDTKRGNIVVVGGGDLIAYNVGAGSFAKQAWSATGGDAIVSGGGPGFDYDPVSDRLVGWSGGAVYALNPDTKAWASYNPSGAPSRTPNGIYGRWRYVPAVNAFICVTGVGDNVHFYKLTAGGTATEGGKSSAPYESVLSISPNPVCTGGTISFSGVAPKTLNIYDVRGGKIQELSVSPWTPWQIKSIPAGIYLVKWTDKNGLSGQKRLAVIGK